MQLASARLQRFVSQRKGNIKPLVDLFKFDRNPFIVGQVNLLL
jgi:hypothetical protein